MASKSKQLWSCSGPYFTARGFITNCRLLLMTLPENRYIVWNDKMYGLYHLKYKTNLQLRFSTFHGSKYLVNCSNVLQESKINWTLIIIIMIWMWPFFPYFLHLKYHRNFTCLINEAFEGFARASLFMQFLQTCWEVEMQRRPLRVGRTQNTGGFHRGWGLRGWRAKWGGQIVHAQGLGKFGIM